VPPSYVDALQDGALRGARIGVLRPSRDTAAEFRANRRDSSLAPDSLRVLDSLVRYRAAEYAKVAPVVQRALDDLVARGAVLVDSLTIPRPAGRRIGNDFETEAATDAYLAQHQNAPVKTLKEIVLAGTVTPWRAVQLLGYLNRSTDDAGFLALQEQRAAQRDSVLQLMAAHRLDAIVYATFDAPPQPIGAEVLTSRRPVDGYGLGDNRGISPTLGFPALTVPAGFSPDGLPVGLELLGRPFSEARLLALAFDYEQATRRRRPPPLTPALAGR
jgi:Asp-tRNA(Asn)/Glu-tRNA(Gln) amidotransferase A subunit family amidase